MWHFGGLLIVLLQLKDPLELFVKRKEFLPGSGFISHRDVTLAIESDLKTKHFLPSLLSIVCVVSGSEGLR